MNRNRLGSPHGALARRGSRTAFGLAQLATALLRRPQDAMARRALDCTVADVLRTEGDGPLLAAIDAATNVRLARLLYRAAEAASESAWLGVHGSEQRWRLFAAALVMQLPEPLTTSEFDQALGAAAWTRQLHALLAHGPGSMLPYAFFFEDLRALSFTQLHAGLISVGTSLPHGAAIPFPLATLPARRSATQLRYLVGVRSDTPAAPPQHARFGAAVRALVQSRLPQASAIRVLDDCGFHEALWRGLESYQRVRLAASVRTMTAKGSPRGAVTAAIALRGTARCPQAHLALFASPAAAPVQAYRLALRPFAEPPGALAQLVAVLQTLGVRAQVIATGEAEGNRAQALASPRAHGLPWPRTGLLLPL